MRGAEKKTGFLIFLMFLGAISGSFVGDILGNTSKSLSFLKYIYTIGTPKPVSFDLKVIAITLGLNFNVNIMSIIGIVLAIILYRKL